MLALYLVAKQLEQPQALLLNLDSATRTVNLLFKVIDMCTPWSLKTRPISKTLAKTLKLLLITNYKVLKWASTWLH